MPRLKLIPTNLHTLPPGPGGARAEYRDTDTPGLALRVYASGERVWVVGYKFGGRAGTHRRFKLGPFGKRTGLRWAREEARKVRAQVALGVDPQMQRNADRREVRARRSALTVAALVRQYLDATPLAASTATEWRRLHKKEIAGQAIGREHAAAAAKEQFRAWGRALAARAPSTARATHEILRAAYAWGVRQDLVRASPFVALDPPARRGRSDRVLSRAELRAVLRALRRFGGQYGPATLLMLLTLARKSMVLGARREEFDLEGLQPLWVVPAGRTGLKRRARAQQPEPHLVPLSEPARDVVVQRLEAIGPREACLFPSARPRRRGQRRKRDSAWWSSRFMDELRVAVAEEFTGKVVDRKKAAEVAAARDLIPRWTIHNLRHTAATLMREELGVKKSVVRLLLAHVQRRDATSIYDRAQLLRRRRAALVAWAAWLDQLERSKPQEAEAAAKVVPIEAGGRNA